jgi:hypothetical protein
VVAGALGRSLCFLLGLGLAIFAPGVEGVQVIGGGRVLVLGLALMLGVDGRHVCGGLGMGSGQARLLAVTYEILEALDCTHDDE